MSVFTLKRPILNLSNIPLVDITHQDYVEAALALGCEVNAIKAVAAVESGGAGFLATGEVRILFEPHVFWKQLQSKGARPELVLQAYPEYADVLYKQWKTRPYGKNSEQWDRLRKAATININAAYESASFGKFQILGMHYKACGYRNIFEMAHYLNLGEKYHLQMFVKFLLSTGLHVYLQKKNWSGFAKRYNGPGYKNSPKTILDDYDYKIKTMYAKLSVAS